jgi:hypothetical protein
MALTYDEMLKQVQAEKAAQLAAKDKFKDDAEGLAVKLSDVAKAFGLTPNFDFFGVGKLDDHYGTLRVVIPLPGRTPPTKPANPFRALAETAPAGSSTITYRIVPKNGEAVIKAMSRSNDNTYYEMTYEQVIENMEQRVLAALRSAIGVE